MGVKKIWLQLTTRSRIFYDGDLVHGVCHAEISGSPVQGVVMKFRGQAKTQWQPTGRSFKDHTAKIVLLNKHILITNSQGVLQPGYHQLAFTFRLPSPVATSYEGLYGYVRYSIEAEAPSKGNYNLTPEFAKLELKVVQLIDSNLPQYRFPITGKDTRDVSSWFCCASGPLFIEASTDRGAYCPRDGVVTITAIFRNNSSNKQARPYAKLWQNSRFHDDTGNTKVDSYSWNLEPVGVMDGTQNYIFEGGCATWNGLQFKLPMAVPSLDCTIIQVRYEIEVGLDVAWASDLAVFLPIIIATVPFRGEPLPDASTAATTAAQWSGIGRRTRNSLRTAPTAPPLLQPPETSTPNKDDNPPPPNYFETLLFGQVASVDKDKADEMSDDERRRGTTDSNMPSSQDQHSYFIPMSDL